jgi:Tc3 transposase
MAPNRPNIKLLVALTRKTQSVTHHIIGMKRSISGMSIYKNFRCVCAHHLSALRIRYSKRPWGPLRAEERALCRVMYDHGVEEEEIARKMARKVHCIQRTIKNDYRSPDNMNRDYSLLSDDMRRKYPPLVSTLSAFSCSDPMNLSCTCVSLALDDLAQSSKEAANRLWMIAL